MAEMDVAQLIENFDQNQNLSLVCDELKKQIESNSKVLKPFLQELIQKIEPIMYSEQKLEAVQLTQIIMENYAKDVEKYIQPLIKASVINLGDASAQVRKGSHYGLLNFVHGCLSFEQVSSVFIKFGFSHNNWVNKQKSINSFQSLIISESKFINWNSYEFKLIIESLLGFLSHDNRSVMKASEQCLGSLLKKQGFSRILKRLSQENQEILRNYVKKQNNTQEYDLPSNFISQSQDVNQLNSQGNQKQEQGSPAVFYSQGSGNKTEAFTSKTNFQNSQQQQQYQMTQQNQPNSQFNISVSSQSTNPFQNLGQNIANFNLTNNFYNSTNTSMYSQNNNQNTSHNQTKNIAQNMQPPQSGYNTSYSNFSASPSANQFQNYKLPQSSNLLQRNQIDYSNSKNNQNQSVQQQQYNQQIQWKKDIQVHVYFGFLTVEQYQALNDQKDWKARQNGVEYLLELIQLTAVQQELEKHFIEFTQLMIKLINDSNFKTSLTSLQIINQLIHLSAFNQTPVLDLITPKLILKLGDSKLAIRQTTSKIIMDHYQLSKRSQFIDLFIGFLEEKNQNIKEEILTLIIQFYHLQDYIPYNWEKLFQSIAPLTNDSKTKIQNLSLECLVIVTIKNNREQCKNFLSKALQPEFYEKYIDKLNQEISKQKDNPKPLANQIQQKQQYQNIYQSKSNSKYSKNDQYNQKGYNVPYKQGVFDSNMISTDKSLNSEYHQKMNDSTNQNKPYNAGSYLFELSSASSSRSDIRGQKFNNNLALGPPPNIMSQNIRIQSAQNSLETMYNFDKNDALKSSPLHPNYQRVVNTANYDQNQHANHINKQNQVQDIQEKISNSGENNTLNQQQESNSDIDDNVSGYNPSAQEKKSVRKLPKNFNQNNTQMNSDQQLQQNQQFQGQTSPFDISLKNSTNNSSQVQKVPVKSNVFQPPINIYSKQISNQNNEEDKQSDQASNYPYKPPMIKKSIIKNQKSNQQDDIKNDDLIIKSKEYQNKNYLQNSNSMSNDERDSQDEAVQYQMTKPKNVGRFIKPKKMSISNQDDSTSILDEDTQSKSIQINQQPKKYNQKPNLRKKVMPLENQFSSAQKSKSDIGSNINDNKQQSYHHYHELQPLNNPEKYFKDMQRDIKNSDDWSKQFEAITICRRLIKNHPQIINSSQFSSFLIELIKLIDNLRSNLAKNAMLAVQEISNISRKYLDPVLEKIFQKLMKKCLDTNTFLQEEVKKSVVSICQNQSDLKLIPTILSLANSKSISQKIMIILGVETIIERLQDQPQFITSQNYEKIIQILGNWISDGNLDVRKNSRQAFCLLLKYNSLETITAICKKIFSEIQYKKIQPCLQNNPSSQNLNTQTFNDIKFKLTQTFCNKQINGSQNISINDKSSNKIYENDYVGEDFDDEEIQNELQFTKHQSYQKQSVQNNNFNKFKPALHLKKFSSDQNQLNPTNQLQNLLESQENNSQNQINFDERKNRYNLKSSNDVVRQKDIYGSKSSQPGRNNRLSATSQLKPTISNSKDPQIFDELPQLYSQISDNDWKKRIDTASKIQEIAQNYTSNILKPKHSQKFMDSWKKLIADSNFKVAVHSLQCFQKLIPDISIGIEQNILIIGSSLIQQLGSNNTNVKLIAEQTFETLLEYVDLITIYPILCNQAQYGNQKSRIYLLKQLPELSEQMNEIKPNTCGKIIKDVIIKGMDDNNKDIKLFTKSLAQSIFNLLGQNFIAELPNNKKKQVQDFIEN